MKNTIRFAELYENKILAMSEEERFHFREGLSDGLKPEFDRFIRDQGTLQVAQGSDLEKWMARGYTVLTNYVVYGGELKPITRLTYIVLLTKLFGKDYCFPGQEILAQEVNCSTDSIQRGLQELKQNGWLDVKRRGQGKTNIYYLKKI